MTADKLLSLAINVANGWSLEDLSIDDSAALRKMLAEVYEQLLDTHRKAVERTKRSACGSIAGHLS